MQLTPFQLKASYNKTVELQITAAWKPKTDSETVKMSQLLFFWLFNNHVQICEINVFTTQPVTAACVCESDGDTAAEVYRLCLNCKVEPPAQVKAL